MRAGWVCCWVVVAVVADRLPAWAHEPNRVGMSEVTLGGDVFQVRKGYSLTKIAGDDLVTRPTVCDWDDQGRLVVCESSGTHESTREQLETRPHRVVRLIDRDGDGEFDSRLVAAEDLSFYSGVLCDGNDIYVSTPPSILKLIDADGDGVCESREVWHDGGTLTYCANDLHGPYRGPDGWIYWCKGAFAEQTHHLPGGKTRTSKAAHVLRKRPEGGPVEIVISGGMDNPIELAFLPSGDKFFTSTFLHQPSGGVRDGIAHAVYGSVFGKRHGVIEGLPRTGELMPVMTELGPAAPSGLERIQFGRASEDILVCAQFNLHRVSEHRLIPDGATYRSVGEVLMVSDRLEFHPTDVIEDADGSLVVLDTGDWYDLCCPSSGAEESKATGGIYRLRRDDAHVVQDPWGNQIAWSQLSAEQAVALLGDDRTRARSKAADWLVNHGAAARSTIDAALRRGSLPAVAQCDLIGIVSRMETNLAIQILERQLNYLQQLEDADTVITTATLNALSMTGITRPTLLTMVLEKSPNAAVKRAAAECIGRHGDRSCLPSLFEQLAKAGNDRTLKHSLLFAAMELDDRAGLKNYIGPQVFDAQPIQAAAAISLLEQMDPSEIDPRSLLSAMLSSDSGLRSVAVQTLRRHPGWATNCLGELRQRWDSVAESNHLTASVLDLVAAWHEKLVVRDWITEALHDALATSSEPTQTHDRAIRRVATLVTATRPKRLPDEWDASIGRLLQESESPTQLKLIEWLAGIEVSADDRNIVHALTAMSNHSGQSSALRLRAAAALPPETTPLSHGVSQLAIDVLLTSESSDEQGAAGAVLSRVRLSVSAAEQLLKRSEDVPTRFFPLVVEAIAKADQAVATKLLDRLPEMNRARMVMREQLVASYAEYDLALRSRAEQVADAVSRPPRTMADALMTLDNELPKGDAVRGMRVFHGRKAACGVCHQYGYVGGRIGPELTRIGKSRSRLALLEAIVYPSSHIAQGYRSIKLLTLDGTVYQGLVAQESDEEITLTTGIDRTVTVAKDEIEVREESEVSLMPSGLEGSVSRQELADLLVLLKEG
ncbi:MAG: hypothetical protein AAGA03_10090 [Planctomycetota bacterium]